MCDVIHAMIDEGVKRGIQEGLQGGIQQGFQRGFQEGFQKGKLEGINLANRLFEILLDEGSMDKFKRATKDEDYRYELLKEYHLI